MKLKTPSHPSPRCWPAESDQALDQLAAESFRSLWKQSMHWVYNGMAEALDTWERWGIARLPTYRPAVRQLLREDIEQDSEFLAMLRSRAAAVPVPQE